MALLAQVRIALPGSSCYHLGPEYRPLSRATFSAGSSRRVGGVIDGRFIVGKRLYIGNLGYDVSSSDLERMLSEHGNVESAEVISDRVTGQSKGFGFVEMTSEEEADAAIAALNGQEHDGRALTVNEARPREQRGGGRGGYGGGGRDRY